MKSFNRNIRQKCTVYLTLLEISRARHKQTDWLRGLLISFLLVYNNVTQLSSALALNSLYIVFPFKRIFFKMWNFLRAWQKERPFPPIHVEYTRGWLRLSSLLSRVCASFACMDLLTFWRCRKLYQTFGVNLLVGNGNDYPCFCIIVAYLMQASTKTHQPSKFSGVRLRIINKYTKSIHCPTKC